MNCGIGLKAVCNKKCSPGGVNEVDLLSNYTFLGKSIYFDSTAMRTDGVREGERGCMRVRR